MSRLPSRKLSVLASYIYDGAGKKLGTRSRISYLSDRPLTTYAIQQPCRAEDHDYIGNYEFKNGRVHRVNTPYGYITMGVFIPYERDYQGNNRNHASYYSYGLPVQGSEVKDSDPYLYGGKEFYSLRGVNIYVFNVRAYAPDIARFMQPDPNADDYHWLSPYAYCGGDPINRVDPDGCDWVSRVVNGVTEYFYDRNVTSQDIADDIYGIGVVTHIPDGTQISIGEYTYTFNNDLKENKYGTVLKNDVLQDNSKIIYGDDYTIFGTTDESCNAATLHKNYFGTSYTGPHNPLDYNGDYSYQYIPKNRSEFGSIAHDKAYDSANAEGLIGALFNCSEGVVKADIRLVNYNVKNVIYAPSHKDKARSLVTAGAYHWILLNKTPIYICNKIYNSVKQPLREQANLFILKLILY